MNKILIIDDEPAIREILAFNLTNEGYAVDEAASAEQALTMLTAEHSLILLDVMMDGMSGYRFAEHLRQKGNNIPIIFLTAKDTENDLLTGFAVGGTDYIRKPFSIKEVLARVKAHLRPALPASVPSVLHFGDMTINQDNKEVVIGEQHIELTRTEFSLLLLLASNPHRIFTREEIISIVWKETLYITERTVDVHIARLRRKLGDYSSCITNRSGFGYRFNTP